MIWALAYLGVGMVTLFAAAVRQNLRGSEPSVEGCVVIIAGWPVALCVGAAELVADAIQRRKSTR